MPITAKLSKQFYDKFGNAVVDELVNWFNAVDATYKEELRELNELNFARFDAKLEQRAAELRTDIQTGLARLERGLLAPIGTTKRHLARLTLAVWHGPLAAVIRRLNLSVTGTCLYVSV